MFHMQFSFEPNVIELRLKCDLCDYIAVLQDQFGTAGGDSFIFSSPSQPGASQFGVGGGAYSSQLPRFDAMTGTQDSSAAHFGHGDPSQRDGRG